LLVGGLLLASPGAHAQITFSNFLEARVGNDPDDPRPNVPDSRYTFFDQFNIEYARDNLILGLRYEVYVPSEDRTLEYKEFVHRFAEWNSDWVDARVGNFNAMFGRGLVLRAFEVTGVVREELWRQFGDSRDLDGVKVRLHRSNAELLALSGKPRRANDPPDAERFGLVSGVQGTLRPQRGLRIGGEYVRLDTQSDDLFSTPGRTSEAFGGFARIAFDPWLRDLGVSKISLDSYVELAAATGLPITPVGGSPNVPPGEGRGRYFAQNVFLEDLVPGMRVGASWEYKDYQNFLLLGGINEPPQLVREHTYTLLNRNTHVLEPEQEEGYQFEATFDFARRVAITLNWSRAENRYAPALIDPASGALIDPPRPRRFREFYAEVTGRNRGAALSLFTGDSSDGAAGVADRRTLGTYGLLPVTGTHSVEFEVARMTATRVFRTAPNIGFEDRFALLTYSWAGRFSLSAVRQTTDDPADAGDPDPQTGRVPRRAFDSLSGSLRLGNHHELILFWGKRRGGLQCTAGTCYLVPAFDGFLVQLASRF
jgi:hypothetical protein